MDPIDMIQDWIDLQYESWAQNLLILHQMDQEEFEKVEVA